MSEKYPYLNIDVLALQSEYVKTITFQNSNNSYCNILKINENEFVTSSCNDKCLKFWNSNNYSNIATINNIEPASTSRALCIIEDDILCVGGTNSKGFYLIKISTHQIIKNIIGPKTIYSISTTLAFSLHAIVVIYFVFIHADTFFCVL